MKISNGTRSKLLFTVISILLCVSLALAQPKPAYVLYNAQGQEVDYGDMLRQASLVDVVLFGELHNNPIAHWLQFELTRGLYELKGPQLILGAEMFEADNQLILNEYLSGQITESNFTAQARLWPNYKTDYKPLVELAKENGLKFIATNIPRRYASMVHRGGFEALEGLPAMARLFIAPLPVLYDPELPGYKAMLNMSGMPAHGSQNFPKAQAIKDATMAHFIVQNLPYGHTFIHYHGTYHSKNYEGIAWYLQQLAGKTTFMTINTVEQDDPGSLLEEHTGSADFIIVVPSSMTKTY